MQALSRLTSLRAFAAAGVFGYHLNYDLHWRPAEILFPQGYTGVAFFFILSGFVLTWSLRPGTTTRDFYQRRFARVWPNHFAMAVVAMLAAGALAPWHVLIPNLLLIQAWFPSDPIAFGVNTASWSLSCEAFFYAVFPGLIWAARRTRLRLLTVAALSWFAVTSTATVVFAYGDLGNVAYVNPLIRSGEFVLGVLLAEAMRRGWRPRFGLPVAVLAVALLAAVTHRTHPPLPVPDLLMVPAFCMVLVSAAAADLRGVKGILQSRWLIYLGEISFAFYLVQGLTIRKVMALTELEGFALVVACTAASVVAAVLLHHLVERPAQRRLSPKRQRVAEVSGTSAA